MILSLSILLLSASILSFEIIVIRLLAISHWQPFVTLAISTALLGYGLSGSLLVKLRDRVFPRRHLVYPALLVAAALVYRPVIYASGRLHLDPGLIIRDPFQWLKVGLLIVVLTVPFILASGALALPLLERESVGKYYGWNFLGAAVGIAIVLVALGTLDPEDLPKVPVSLVGFALLASLIHFHRDRKGLMIAAAGIVLLLLIYPAPPTVYGPYKDISYALRLPSAGIVAHKTGVTGKFQVVTAPALRSAAGLSTKYRGGLPAQAALYRNGDRMGTAILSSGSHNEGIQYLGWQTAAAPYILLGPGARTAIVGFDGGEETARALFHGSPSPEVIEPDGVIDTLVEDHPDIFTRWIFGPGAAAIVRDSARSHFNSGTWKYNLIVYTAGTNLAAAAAGLTGTAENYQITVEGMKTALGSLEGGGLIAVTGWNQSPPTGQWKLLGLLRRIGLLNGNPASGNRVYIVSGWSNHTFLIRAQPFLPAQLQKLSSFCDTRGFSLTSGDLFPGPETGGEPGSENVWTDDLDLRPPTDSRPYPWHSLKLSYLKHLIGETREAAFPRVEWGFFFLVMVLVITTVSALIALTLSRPRTGGGLFFGLYFGCLGMGYMTLEILLIKRSGLVVGPPAVTTAVVLGSFLVFSGLGSHVAGKAMARNQRPVWVFPAIVLFSGLAYLLIPTLLVLPFPARVFFLAVMVAPPAFAMGFPFPSALMLHDRDRESLVSWAWALNGFTSVIGSSLAGVLAVTTGFGALFTVGAGCYITAGMIYSRSLMGSGCVGGV